MRMITIRTNSGSELTVFTEFSELRKPGSDELGVRRRTVLGTGSNEYVRARSVIAHARPEA